MNFKWKRFECVTRILWEEVSLFSFNLGYNCKEIARRPFGRPWNDTVMYIYAWPCGSRPRDRCVCNAVKWGTWALVWVRWNRFLSNTVPLAAVFEAKRTCKHQNCIQPRFTLTTLTPFTDITEEACASAHAFASGGFRLCGFPLDRWLSTWPCYVNL